MKRPFRASKTCGRYSSKISASVTDFLILSSIFLAQERVIALWKYALHLYSKSLGERVHGRSWQSNSCGGSPLHFSHMECLQTRQTRILHRAISRGPSQRHIFAVDLASSR